MKSIIEESGCDLTDAVLDPTHRVSKMFVNARFTIFRHRTMFYQARKRLSKNGVHLDLTKERLALYQKARDWVKLKKSVKHVVLM